MARRLVANLVALYAVAFAFAAIMALRLPTLAILSGVVGGDGLAQGFAGIDWRRLSIYLALPYTLASLFFFASAALLARRRHGALAWFANGGIAGFPCLFLFEFSAGWWASPSPIEQAALWGATGTLALAMAIWSLRRPGGLFAVRPAEKGAAGADDGRAKRRRAGPTSAAIIRQRESFARHGRAMMARRRSPRL